MLTHRIEKIIMTRTSLFGCALASAVSLALCLSPSPAGADIACYPYGFATYEADGTIATMSVEGRWQRWAPGAQEPLSERQTGLFLGCYWSAGSVGEVAPDGSYLVVLSSVGLRKITAQGDESLLGENLYVDEMLLTFTDDGRIVTVATGENPDGSTGRRLFVESAAGSGDFSLSHPIENRCETGQISTLAQVSTDRVAVICTQGVLILDLQTGETHHSGTLGQLGDDTLHAMDSWYDGDGAVIYVLSADGGQPSDAEIVVQLSQVRMAADGTTDIETIVDDLTGWRRHGDVAAIDENRLAVRGDAGLEYMTRGADGAWSSQVVAPEVDGNRIEAMAEPTRILVSGWTVTDYSLGADGQWEETSLAAVGDRPTYGERSACSAGGSGTGATFAAVLLILFAARRRRSTRTGSRAVPTGELC